MEALSLEEAVRQSPGALAWESAGRRLTFRQAADVSGSMAERLIGEGVLPGDRVAFTAQPSIETLVTLFAIRIAKATAVPLHPRLTAEESAVLISRSGARLSLDPSAQRTLMASPRRRPVSVPRGASPLTLVFTSGTSGEPKGALLSSGAFRASAAALEKVLPFGRRERWLLCMPLAHVGGLSIVTRSLLARRPVVLLPRFDPAEVLRTIVRSRISRLSVVPTMLQALLPLDRQAVLRRLSMLMVGGAACPSELLAECRERGLKARTTYGLTESCSAVTLSGPSDGDAGSFPLPGIGLRIRGGRIELRGPTLMDGYLGERPLKPGQWFDTGDLGELSPEGRLRVDARRSDLIITGGENVSPLEIERVLEAFPGVRSALAFGVPDPRWGQLVGLAVVTDPIRGAPGEVLRRLAAASLASHKRPRRICFVDELPCTPSGKPDRAGAAAKLGRRLAEVSY